jgi:hypothetical protein
MSPVGMGLLTGLVVRLYRAVTLQVGPMNSMVYVGMAFVLGQMIILGLATLHLGNFTLRRWLYLAPVFAIAEVTAEVLVSLGLVVAGLERLGSRQALFADWPGIALSTFVWRLVVIVLYATLLAGVVQLVRYLLLKREHREGTLERVTAEQTAVKGE